MNFPKAKSEEELRSIIDEIRINGFQLPYRLRERIKQNQWIPPENRTSLENLVLACSPFKDDRDLIKGMIKSFSLYGLKLMHSETEGFKKWAHFGEKTMFHGAVEAGIDPGEINPEKLILFADFGLGNDTPFGLDYSKDDNNPSVVLLYYGRDVYKDNRWVKIASRFEEFEEIVWA